MAKKYLFAVLLSLSLCLAMLPRLVNSVTQTCEYHPEVYQGLSQKNLTAELTTNGLIGRIHGAASSSQMYVLSVREPDNFFSHREFSLIPSNSQVSQNLSQLYRHDLVCVQGQWLDNPSPQAHLALDKLKIVESWPQPEGFTPYERQAEIPTELRQKTSLKGQVHAIAAGGKILVIGYQDAVVPIFVTATEHTQELYRGDIIELAYQVQQAPHQPLHLQLDSTVPEPIKIIDAIVKINGKSQTITGNLVKFPQSPQLKFDVYALEVAEQGINRYFTLINFEDIQEFKAIRQKLAKIWDANASTAVAGRNLLINPAVQITVFGIGNMISPEQANPQILLSSREQIKQLAENAL